MSQRLKKNPDFACRKVAGEMILIPIKKRAADFESLFTLNEVGSLVWDGVEQGQTREAIAKSILAEYDGDSAQVKKDLDSFLSQLLKIGAVSES